MCTNGSSSRRSTPAKARRTGKPSPSKPEGAVVTERTGRSAAVGSTLGIRGRATVSALMAGMTAPWAGPGYALVHSQSRVLARTTFQPRPLRVVQHLPGQELSSVGCGYPVSPHRVPGAPRSRLSRVTPGSGGEGGEVL